MSNPPSPREVVEALMRGISDGAWHGLHEWYAADATVDYPFALPAPSRLDGRDAIQKYFAGAARLPLQMTLRDMVVHETADPEVVVAEWNYDIRATDTGRSFQVANVQVSRVRNGKIVESRDYHNHALLAGALGRLPAVLERLKTTDRTA